MCNGLSFAFGFVFFFGGGVGAEEERETILSRLHAGPGAQCVARSQNPEIMI